MVMVMVFLKIFLEISKVMDTATAISNLIYIKIEIEAENEIY
jgi:hypothetical protein